MTTSIVSKADLAGFVNISVSDVRFDEVLQSFAIMSSTLIESFLGRGLDSKVRTETFQSYRSYAGDELAQVHWLSAYPVDPSASFTLRFSPTLEWDVGLLLVENNHFWMDREEGILNVVNPSGATVQSSLLPAGGTFYGNHPAGFRVTYTGGYEESPDSDPEWPFLAVPKAMATAAAMQTAFYFNAHTKGSLGLDSSSGDSPSAQKTKPVGTNMEPWGGLIPEVRAALRPFVRRGSLMGSVP